MACFVDACFVDGLFFSGGVVFGIIPKDGPTKKPINTEDARKFSGDPCETTIII
jgi:hypothetical protein